jgi:hypothetical protein
VSTRCEVPAKGSRPRKMMEIVPCAPIEQPFECLWGQTRLKIPDMGCVVLNEDTPLKRALKRDV